MFTLKQASGDLKRMRSILGVVVEEGGGLLIQRLRLQYLVPWKCRIHCFFRRPASDRCLLTMRGAAPALQPEIVRRVLERLGPTFIKLGQILSLRADVVGEDISAELSKLQSDVAPFPYPLAREIIIGELKSPPEKLFRSFGKKPVAAASLAQVHHARLRDGTEVAVKIQRPNIRTVIERDIHILFSLAHAAEKYLPELGPYQPVRVIKEFAEWTLRELDFTIEGNNAERFRFAFKDNPHINIPTVYWQFTTPRVLTMDFVHGVKADDVEGIRRLRSNTRQLALYGLDAMFQQFLIDGFFHADPHPGNFFAMKGNVLCLHDFGMVGSLTVEQRKELVGCFVAFEQKDIDGFLRHFMHLAKASAGSDVSGFRKDASEVLSQLFFTPRSSSIAWAFFRLINKGAARSVSFPADFALFGKAIITTEAMGLKLYPRFDFNKEFQPFVGKAMQSYLNPKRAIQEFKIDMFDYLGMLKTLPEKTQGILNKIDSGELGVKIDAAELLGIKTEFDRQNDVRILGGATIALFVLSAIFAYWEGRTSIGGVPVSSIGFAAAVASLVWLASKIARKPSQ